MIAALPMYDWPELRAVTDAFWSRLARRLAERGVTAPPNLDRSRPLMATWHHPELLFSQTCGYPYINPLRDQVTLLATPVYQVAGCRAANYRSWILVAADTSQTRLEDLPIDVIAINERHSFSGHVALRAILAPLAMDAKMGHGVIVTGSHRASMRAVADGRATLCAVDPVCWALARRFDSDVTDRLKIIERGPEAPAPPFIAGANISASVCLVLRQALLEQIDDPACADLCTELYIGGAQVLDDADYDPINQIAEAALSE
jgi:ABC-type phosphate/phosphonate transport system substrate-binding protein